MSGDTRERLGSWEQPEHRFDMSDSKDRRHEPSNPTIRSELQRVRNLSIGVLVLLVGILVFVGIFAITVVVAVSKVATSVQSTLASAQGLLSKPELQRTIENVNALIASEELKTGISRVSAFMAKPEISNILSAANNAIEAIPKVEDLILPLIDVELSNLFDTLKKFAQAAALLDPKDAVQFVQKNRLLERVVDMFNLLDRVGSDDQIAKLQSLTTELETMISSLKEKGVTIKL